MFSALKRAVADALRSVHAEQIEQAEAANAELIEKSKTSLEKHLASMPGDASGIVCHYSQRPCVKCGKWRKVQGLDTSRTEVGRDGKEIHPYVEQWGCADHWTPSLTSGMSYELNRLAEAVVNDRNTNLSELGKIHSRIVEMTQAIHALCEAAAKPQRMEIVVADNTLPPTLAQAPRDIRTTVRGQIEREQTNPLGNGVDLRSDTSVPARGER